jgi:DNA-binding winged helix-turn-helix (wHTH) protein
MTGGAVYLGIPCCAPHNRVIILGTQPSQMERFRSTQPDRVFRFGPFEVSEPEGELRKNGMPIKLQEQPFRVLVELVANAGKVVAREELQQKMWPGDTFVDFDVGLNTAIRKLRNALNDDADEPRYIETLARRGYRFVASVTDTAASLQPIVAPDADTTAAPIGEDAPAVSSRRAWIWLAAAGCVIAVAAALAAWRIHRKSEIVEIIPLTESGNVFRSAASLGRVNTNS